jgi:hypothetical protein
MSLNPTYVSAQNEPSSGVSSFELSLGMFHRFLRTDCEDDYVNKYCHIPLIRPLTVHYTSNHPVTCTELQSGPNAV